MASEDSIRLTLKSYDWRMLDSAVMWTIKRIEGTGVSVSGPVPLPTKVRRYTVLRGPHIDKKSREHFKLPTHQRLLVLSGSAKAEALLVLSRLELPAGVDVDIN